MSTGLGGASFEVKADTTQFSAGMKRAKEEAARTSQEMGTYMLAFTKAESEMRRAVATANDWTVGQKLMRQALSETTVQANAVATGLGHVGAAGNASQRGLLQAAYAIDDLQYGFRSIVNNIPQMLMFLGPGIAGAAGVAAVAVSQLINHWDTLSVMWTGDMAKLPVLKSGLDGLEESLKKITAAVNDLKEAEEARRTANSTSLIDIATGAGITDKDKLHKLADLQREGKERLKAEKNVAGTEESDIEKETGKLVRAAIGKMGGSGILMDVLTDQGMAPGEAKKAISGALGGNTGFLGDILARTKGQKGEGFAGLANATPERQAEIAQQRLELEGRRNARKMEEKAAAEKLAEVQQQRKWEADGQRNEREAQRKKDREDERFAAERLRVLWRQAMKPVEEMPTLRKIGEGPAQWIGAIEFAKMGGGGNHQLDELRQQTKLLRDIDQKINPPIFNLGGGAAMAAAVAAGPE